MSVTCFQAAQLRAEQEALTLAHAPIQQLRSQGTIISDELLAHVALLGCGHIALTGDYDWNTARPASGLQPLTAVPVAFTLRAT